MTRRHDACASIGDSGQQLDVLVADACERAVAGGWPPRPEMDATGTWLLIRHPDAHVPDQGWKIHISSAVSAAETTLRHALSVLLAEPLVFKVTASLDILNTLNNGHGSLSQIGKFITVYPRDDEQAVRLAVALDTATRGLPGQDIPSDRPLRPGSRVHYRYAASGALRIQNRVGEILPALRTPEGGLVPDLRRPFYAAPEWATDPFLAAGIAADIPAPSLLVANRYLIVALLHRNARGSVYAAVDLDQPRRCVLKQAAKGAQLGISMREPADQLRHEADILRQLASDARFPRLFDLVTDDQNVYLVMEWLTGKTLENYVVERALRGIMLPARQVARWGGELAAMLATIHSAGLVYRDLKSTNVLVTGQGSLQLVDLELACKQGETGVPGTGTRGYLSPQQDAGHPADFRDDIYSLGGLLAYMATGAEPSQAPRAATLLDRPLELLNPEIDADLRRIIMRCLEPEPSLRFPTASALSDSLDSIPKAAVATIPVSTVIAVTTRDGLGDANGHLPGQCKRLALRLGDTLCAVSQRPPGADGRAWVSSHPLTVGMYARDINTGAAGTMLALAELVDAYDSPVHRSVVEEAAVWLECALPPEGAPLPGLYVGEAGIGAALLRAGQVLNNSSLCAAAAARGRLIRTLPLASPDLFNGASGSLRFHLMLWEATQEKEHLAAALAAGKFVVARAEQDGKGGSRWTIPKDYGALSGRAYLGYAHGAAGIGDALLDLYAQTGNVWALETAVGAGRWLARTAVPGLTDGSGLSWPSTEADERCAAAYWCHGVGGIGLFFLHLAAAGAAPDAADIASRCMRSVAGAARWAQPTQCHGLAGGIEILLEAYQMTGDRVHLDGALSLYEVLGAFASERDGLLVWSSEDPTLITPDFMVGYAGVCAALLRLAEAESRPHVLSLRAFSPSARVESRDVEDVVRIRDA